MAAKPTQTDDTAALIEHFTALPFAQQQEVLTACKAVMAEAVKERIAAIDAERAQLVALAGVPDGSAPNQAGVREGQPRGPVEKVYWSRRNPEKGWANRGATPSWLLEETEAFGLQREDFKTKRKFPQYRKDQPDEYETPPK